MEQARFRIVLAEMATGIVLNQEGERWSKGQPFYEPSFETEAEALALKDELLKMFPWAEVWVRDSLTSEIRGVVYEAGKEPPRSR